MLGVLAAMLIQAAAAEGAPPAPKDWAHKPDPGLRYYPERAQAERVEGVAVLDCGIAADGALKDCVIVSEDPLGWGFGPTALRLAMLFHMKPRANGSAPPPVRIQVPIRFKLPPGSGPPEKDPGRGPFP
jgi:protein TonB